MRPMPPLPETRQDPIAETIHGIEVKDPYRWLEDQDSTETRAWIEAQNAYTDSFLERLRGRKRLKKRLTELMRIDVVSRPIARNGRYFFTRRRADQDLHVIYMREGLEGEDQILIDPHTMSPDHSINVHIRDVSDDGSILAYAVREGGEDEVVIRFLDVDRRKDLPDELPKARYFSVSLKPDNSGVYYVRHDQTTGPRVYHHAVGADRAGDREIFGEGYGPGKGMSAHLSEDGRHLVIHVSHGWVKSEIHYQNVAENGPIVPVVTDIDALFYGTFAGDRLYVYTNWQAPNSRILAVDLEALPQPPGQWREIIPARDAVLEDFSAIGGRLFINYLDNVVSRLEVYDADGAFVREIPLPAMGSASGVGGRWTDSEAFFSYSSFAIPTTIYRYDVAQGTREVWAKIDVPVDSDAIAVDQVWYRSKDGTSVPMFLVHKKGIERDGSNPTLLTGYGGFRASLTPDFSSLATVWAEYGGVFARPNLRGGGEFGEDWHRAGMLDNKQNVFDDFIAAAEWLIENRYTNPDRLAISGGSNGGLLVGAALTQRPDLFRAVACFYPLLDMVRYHKFLVAKFWVPEYGSAEDPEQFKYLHAYSPYHNVKPGAPYPAVIFITGDSDTRVAPLHGRKMAALLQDATGSDHPVLLHYDTQAGHSGGRPLSKTIEDTTDWLSFVLWQLDVLKP